MGSRVKHDWKRTRKRSTATTKPKQTYKKKTIIRLSLRTKTNHILENISIINFLSNFINPPPTTTTPNNNSLSLCLKIFFTSLIYQNPVLTKHSILPSYSLIFSVSLVSTQGPTATWANNLWIKADQLSLATPIRCQPSRVWLRHGVRSHGHCPECRRRKQRSCWLRRWQ